MLKTEVLNYCNMEVFENGENKACDLHLMDFPFICRICLRRGDLRFFEQDDYLLDLFVTITKIDVRSKVNFPSNVCNECINELEDISSFINISKYNDSKPGKNMIPKKENEYVALVDFGTSQDPVVKTEKTIEEYEKDTCTEKLCQICLVPSCLTPLEVKTDLMQLFQNITNIDLDTASNFSGRNSICNKCINKLESISWFISLSVSSDMKIESVIGRNGSLKTENCSEGNAIDISSLKCNDMKFDNISKRKEIKVRNYLNESVCRYESKDLHTVFNIKQEIVHSPESSIHVEKLGRDPSKNEVRTENHSNIIPKGLNGSLKALIQTEHFKCDCCEKSFYQKQRLKEHMITHTGEKPFKCDICQKGFGRVQHLKQHMLTHTGEKPFKCNSCKTGFSRKGDSIKHMLTHTGEKPFKCAICPKGFSRVQHLRDHMLTHTGEKPFRCDICQRGFSRVQHLKHHMLTHTGETPFKCNSCKKDFSRQSDLLKHMRTHTGENPIKCDICHKGFSRVQHLKQHMLTHTGEKPFQCDICQKGFGRVQHLKQHMLTHTGEKPFKCNICNKRFSRKGDSMKHMLTHT